MKLTFEQIRSVTNGALRVTEEADGVHFYKCTEQQTAAWYSFSEMLGNGSRCTTGVRLDFITNSKSFSFSAPKGNKFEVWVDGLLRKQFDLKKCRETGETPSLPLCDPLGNEKDEVRVTLWLPSHAAGVLSSVELDDGATIRPYDGYRIRFLFIGDSITQGWNSTYDSQSYAHRVAAHFDASFVNQGIGGAFFHEKCFDKIDFEPDVVTIAYGTNDFGRFKTYDEMRRHTRAYLSLVKEEFPGKRVFVLTPIYREHREGKAMGTFENACAIVKEEALACGFTTIDGLSLVPPLPYFFADHVHPNEQGFGAYAENLIRQLSEQL